MFDLLSYFACSDGESGLTSPLSMVTGGVHAGLSMISARSHRPIDQVG
jgi:hypothetical protein